MKRMIAAFVALLLAVGCSVPPQYPRVPPQAPPTVAPVTLHITLPAEADEILAGAVLLLEAKLKELSGNQISLVTHRADDVPAALAQEDTGLFLLTAGEMAQLDARLSFTQMPFLFENREQLFTLLNNENGAVRRGASTRKKLDGEVVGVYYGGTTWLMGKGTFYDEVGFYSKVGILAGMAGNDCFSAIGGEDNLVGSSEVLFDAFAQGQIKYCELLPTDEIPQPALERMTHLELTNHRFNSFWLVLKNSGGALSDTTVKMTKEAFAYTLEQQESQRLDSEVGIMARLEEKLGLSVLTEERYPLTRQMAKRYYRTNWEQVGIPQDIWAEIMSLLGW